MSRPLISVFTPSHNPSYLLAAYESLKSQTVQDFEWIVLLNGKAINPIPPWFTFEADSRVFVTTSSAKGVGALKREAVELCTADILVELDHDDELATTCLEKVLDAFSSLPNVGFVYSNAAQINADGSANDEQWNKLHGWSYAPVDVQVAGETRSVSAPSTPESLPTNVGYIWYAPNHVRAFRRSTYDATDGYNPDRIICDDHELMIQLYKQAPMYHIDECLYLQRVGTGFNTQKDEELNPQIQQQTVQLYDENIEDMARAWSERNGLSTFECSSESLPDFHGCGENEAGFIKLDNCLHLMDQIVVTVFMKAAYRLLAHGGLLQTITPSTDGRLAFMNPDAASWWNEGSFWYWVNPQWDSQLQRPNETHFQLTRSFTFYPSQWHMDNKLAYVRADLVAIKEGPLVSGVNLWLEQDDAESPHPPKEAE